MCEACRSRHRIYASTKRARRKQEKAALVGIVEPTPPAPPPPVQNTWVLWGKAAIDSQLSSVSVDSISTYPSSISASSDLAGMVTLSAPLNTTITASPRSAVNDEERDSEVTEMVVSDPKDWRECSVRGCTMLIPHVYKYKMCSLCRTRYRTYSTTKREKWKAEREAFDRDLVNAPDFPEKPSDREIPMENATVENKAPTGSARICTVSHCRELLPVTHPYKRCDQHRLQNRHHSQLKRTRDLEAKERAEQKQKEESAKENDGMDTPAEAEMQAPQGNEETRQEDEAFDNENMEQEPKVRRRSSYSCASTDPKCQNILGRDVRWRHCEICRARATINRRKGKEAAEDVTANVERLREIVRRLGGEEKVVAGVEGGADENKAPEKPVEGGGPAPGPEVTAGSPVVARQSSSDTAPPADLKTTMTPSSLDQNYTLTTIDSAPPASVPPAPPTASPTTSSHSNLDLNHASAISTTVPALPPTMTSTFAPAPALNALSDPQIQIFQSVFRAKVDTPAVPHPHPHPVSMPYPNPYLNTNTARNPAPAFTSSPAANPNTATATTTPNTSTSTKTNAPREFTFKEYKPKPPKSPTRTPGRTTTIRMGQRQQTSGGMLSPASYHVYQTMSSPLFPLSSAYTYASYYAPPPVPVSASAPAPEPANKKQKMRDGSGSGSVGASTTETSASSSSTAIPHKRKPRSAPAPASASAPISVPPTHPYPHPQTANPYLYPYPYPYPYPPPYSYPYYLPPGYAYPLPVPSTSASHPSPSPSYMYPYSYPYAYAYPPYAYPYPAPPPHSLAGYVSPRYGGGVQAGGGKETAFSYYRPAGGCESEKKRRKRKKEQEGEQEEKSMEKGSGGVMSKSTGKLETTSSHLPQEQQPPPSPHAVMIPFTLQASSLRRREGSEPLTSTSARVSSPAQPQQHQAADSPSTSMVTEIIQPQIQSQTQTQELQPKSEERPLPLLSPPSNEEGSERLSIEPGRAIG
ncbi:hypothetical protein J132_08055 [Termitomyces sp. J132]|nr:hypothetical protein J132_08055 [Termitomyces sp. J132]